MNYKRFWGESQVHKARARRGRRRMRRPRMRPMAAYIPHHADEEWEYKRFFKRYERRVGRYGWAGRKVK